MFKVYKKEIEVAGKKVSLETGKARCPFDFHDQELGENGGLVRVTRHPMLYSIGLCGLGIGLTSLNLGTMCLLSGPLFVAFVGTHHQDYRYRRNIGGTLTPEKEKTTSNIPFVALLAGRNDWYELFNELKKMNINKQGKMKKILTLI